MTRRPLEVAAASFSLYRWFGFRLWLAVLALLALSRTVEASSCHVAERPALGIQLPGQESPHFSLAVDDPSRSTLPAFHRLPCPGDPSSPTARTSFDQAANFTTIRFDPPLSLEDEVDTDLVIRPPLATFLRLERPPRLVFTAFA
jgi:hypothetical protein